MQSDIEGHIPQNVDAYLKNLYATSGIKQPARLPARRTQPILASLLALSVVMISGWHHLKI